MLHCNLLSSTRSLLLFCNIPVSCYNCRTLAAALTQFDTDVFLILYNALEDLLKHTVLGEFFYGCGRLSCSLHGELQTALARLVAGTVLLCTMQQTELYWMIAVCQSSLA